MLIRKFYNPDAAEATSAADNKFKVGNSFSFQEDETQTFEQAGEKIKEENDTIVKDERVGGGTDTKTEPKEEKKEEEKKTEEVKTEKPSIVSDWRDSLKNPENLKEAFTLLGLDEEAYNLSKELKQDQFVNKLVTYRKQNGNLTPFIEAATRDWDKVKHNDLIMEDLKKQYSHLSSEKAERLARVDFNERYIHKDDINLSEDENKEMADLKELKLESEAEKIRQARKAEQAQFLDSVKPVDTKAEAERLAKERADAEQKEFTAFKTMVEADPETVRLLAEKAIVVGQNGSSHKYTVNPDVIKEQTFDVNKFYGKFWEGNKFNIPLWNKVVAYSENPEAFEKFIFEKALNKGEGKIVEELENATEIKSSKSEVKKESLAKAIEKAQPFKFE